MSTVPDASFSVTDGALPPELGLLPTGFLVGSTSVAGIY